MERDPDQLMPGRDRDGFSLLELLTVAAIMAILTVMTGPSLILALRGGKLSVSTDTVTGVLELARLTSLSRQRPVEVRLYAYTDTSIPGGSGGVHALQAFVAGDNGAFLPLGPARALADRVVITTNPVLTTLWSLPASSPQVRIPRAGLSYSCRVIGFQPDGSTSLAASGTSAPWAMTLLSASEDKSGMLKPPRNFATVVIDPLTGAVRTYRPSLP